MRQTTGDTDMAAIITYEQADLIANYIRSVDTAVAALGNFELDALHYPTFCMIGLASEWSPAETAQKLIDSDGDRSGRAAKKIAGYTPSKIRTQFEGDEA